jgi:ABC-type glycerol-3-phosphate transport system substrate-binding protein
VLEYAKKLMAVIPPDVYAWDDAGNNRWLISGKGSGIMNPPSAWAVAKRDNPKVSENCWTHPMPRGPKGRFVGQLPQFYGLWSFSKNKAVAKDFLLFISQKPQVAKLVEASFGYDLPSFRSMYDPTPGRPSGRRSAPSTAIHRAPMSRRRSPAHRRVRRSARRSTTRPSTP